MAAKMRVENGNLYLTDHVGNKTVWRLADNFSDLGMEGDVVMTNLFCFSSGDARITLDFYCTELLMPIRKTLEEN